MWIGVEGEELVLKDAINNWITANGQPFQVIILENSCQRMNKELRVDFP